MPDTLNLDGLKPGQTVRCTVAKTPRTEDAQGTIERLMRKDLANRRALRSAQTKRRQRMVVYNRGNRDWVSRENPARVVRAIKGQTWTMVWTPDLAPDFRSVQSFLTVASA